MLSLKQQLAALPLLVLVTAAGAALAPRSAAADGALAIGVAPKGAQDGFVYAFNDRRASVREAEEDALRSCRTSKHGNEAARKLCRVVATFQGECVAIAMDPKNGTPGVGWAIGPSLKTAEDRALAQCEVTAGPDRSGFCKIDKSKCDQR
ncbi:MAG: DUF4189 domain-containing protein [Hyphomicrobiaceae bacterium]|nr:MAG: DUF4189 domain-containing protein [Hyphomicrobiaceae bacterium]